MKHIIFAASLILLIVYSGQSTANEQSDLSPTILQNTPVPAPEPNPSQPPAPVPAPNPAPAPAPAPEQVTSPKIIITVPGVMQTLQLAEAKPDSVQWIKSGGDLIPSESGKWAIFCSATPGTFNVWAVYTVAGKLATNPQAWIIQVGSGPGPNPNPKPAPQPTPAGLLAKLLVAFTSDQAHPNVKHGHLAILLGIFEAAIDHAKQPGILTAGDLLADLKAVSASQLAPKALAEVRAIIAAEISAAIGTDPTAKLDSNLRTKAVDVFTAIAKALKDIKETK